ncbi:hypothetical protein THRCLA_22493 [Thraustotheca clavata]|uniref:Protein kinase domain-containing protein n=1 Tax=Thraustotheca clavata TaxID=74557 RepID=A0A1V9YYW8_9STRA|nr:hypothetical protein THRCLA_22493 [Thraustotheca clavata]
MIIDRKAVWKLHYDVLQPPETKEISNRLGKKADLWMIGLVALEMLYGTAHIKRHTPPIPQRILNELRIFLNGCFQIDPRYRPSVQDIQTSPFLQMTIDSVVSLFTTTSWLNVTMKRLQESSDIDIHQTIFTSVMS